MVHTHSHRFVRVFHSLRAQRCRLCVFLWRISGGWSTVLQTVFNRLTQHISSERREGGQAVEMIRRGGERNGKNAQCEGKRKWESTNELMVCSLFSPFCGAQQILVLLLVPLSLRSLLLEGEGQSWKGAEAGREEVCVRHYHIPLPRWAKCFSRLKTCGGGRDAAERNMQITKYNLKNNNKNKYLSAFMFLSPGSLINCWNSCIINLSFLL